MTLAIVIAQTSQLKMKRKQTIGLSDCIKTIARSYINAWVDNYACAHRI
ncbi:hypothetical protein METHB2_200043 [Candidatus Methylobacter favarea]|uniref:Uncharacterized protein n=1 Tax=Candidatus Methylobacter favarea TaxID=2707345 RepID=A0A8S0X7T6_9GAMM|nr:hypothetical protein METHB2_200043 [Candidatus Methylobacter favarea]